MRKHTWGLLAMALAVALTSTATAGDKEKKKDKKGGKHEALFSQLDKNNDGAISSDEVPDDQRLVQHLFKKGDTDSNGELSREEFLAALSDKREKRPSESPSGDRPSRGDGPPRSFGLLGAIDRDHNGELSSEEIAGASDALKKFDKDDDGTVSRRELFIAIAPQQGARPGDRRPEGGRSDARRPDPEAIVKRIMESDEDGDGKLSKEETPERMARGFDRMDSDNDGYLSTEEITVALKAMFERGREGRPGGPAGDRGDAGRPSPEAIVKRIMEADEDGDGKISKDEAPERLARGFDRMDSDDDGYLTSEEITVAMKAMFQRGGDRPGRPEGERGGDRRFDPEAMVDRMMQADKDGDGKISKDEAPERMQHVFDRFDADSDGFVTRDEITSHMKAMAKKANKDKPKKDRKKGSDGDKKKKKKKPDAE